MLSPSISGSITLTSTVVICFLAALRLQREMVEYLLRSFQSSLLWNMVLMWDNSPAMDAALPKPLFPEVTTGRFTIPLPQKSSKATMMKVQGSILQDRSKDRQQALQSQQKPVRRHVQVGFHNQLATIRHYQPTDVPSFHHAHDDQVVLLKECRYPKRPVDEEPPREPKHAFLEDAAQFSPDFVGLFEA